MAKFYAVKVGKTPGIYTDWDTCEQMVKGYPGAKYKSFKTRQDAEAYLTDNAAVIPTIKPVQIEQKPSINHPIAYVDGSYMPDVSTTRVGSGACILFPSGETYEISSSIDDAEFAKMHQVGGEMRAAELAIRKALEKGYYCIIIRHDYEGVAKWATGEWKAKNSYTQAYRDRVQALNNTIKVVFEKVKAHSGNKYNDIADKLAKKSITNER